MDDYQSLAVGKSVWLVTTLELVNYGRAVLIHCLYDPNVRRPYTLRFDNCKDIHLQWRDNPIENGSEASVIRIALGREAHQKPAIITTDILELSVLYEQWDLTWT